MTWEKPRSIQGAQERIEELQDLIHEIEDLQSGNVDPQQKLEKQRQNHFNEIQFIKNWIKKVEENNSIWYS